MLPNEYYVVWNESEGYVLHRDEISQMLIEDITRLNDTGFVTVTHIVVDNRVTPLFEAMNVATEEYYEDHVLGGESNAVN